MTTHRFKIHELPIIGVLLNTIGIILFLVAGLFIYLSAFFLDEYWSDKAMKILIKAVLED